MTQASSTDKRREVVRVELCVYRCKQTQQADGEWVDDDTDITADIVLDNTIVYRVGQPHSVEQRLPDDRHGGKDERAAIP